MHTRIFYAQSPAHEQSTTSGQWADMAGLSLTLPSGAPGAKYAIITLNIPNPYAKGNDYPGCNFTIRVNGKIDPGLPVGCFTSFNKNAGAGSAISPGRVPTTVVARVKLDPKKPTVVQGAWMSIRGATAVVDTPCSISAVVGDE